MPTDTTMDVRGIAVRSHRTASVPAATCAPAHSPHPAPARAAHCLQRPHAPVQHSRCRHAHGLQAQPRLWVAPAAHEPQVQPQHEPQVQPQHVPQVQPQHALLPMPPQSTAPQRSSPQRPAALQRSRTIPSTAPLHSKPQRPHAPQHQPPLPPHARHRPAPTAAVQQACRAALAAAWAPAWVAVA